MNSSTYLSNTVYGRENVVDEVCDSKHILARCTSWRVLQWRDQRNHRINLVLILE